MNLNPSPIFWSLRAQASAARIEDSRKLSLGSVVASHVRMHSSQVLKAVDDVPGSADSSSLASFACGGSRPGNPILIAVLALGKFRV